MGYRERIEDAVKALFELDRGYNSRMEAELGDNVSVAIREVLDYPGNCNVALDLLCIPKDNTCDFDLNSPEYKGEWPEGCFCRDYYTDLWFCDSKNGQEFIDYCYSALKEFAEKDLTFAKPLKR